jgi:hypothetical protein
VENHAVKFVTMVAVLSVAVVGCGGGGSSDKVSFQLLEKNGSGESGTATLTADGDGTKVVLKLDGAPSTAQPAHIHFSQCGGALGDVYYPLQDVVNGESTTSVPRPFSTFQESEYAINVHKSQEDIAMFVACGNIPAG